MKSAVGAKQILDPPLQAPAGTLLDDSSQPANFRKK
jgi:hypothetical protein